MKKKTIIIVASIISAFILLIIIALFCSNKKLNKSEVVSYLSLRVAITRSAAYGDGSIEKDRFDYLKNIAKKANQDWFSSSHGFRGTTSDTAKYQVTQITDGDYTATFTIEQKGSDYKLISYKFEKGSLAGYRFLVKE